MISVRTMDGVMMVYNSVFSALDNVLIGQTDVKKVITSSLLCDTNSRILLAGDTGTGKTTLSNFLASGFRSERISVTSDMIPSEVQNQLKYKTDMQLLQVDEFNRASGKVQSTFIELFAEKKMSINGVAHHFNDFYVIATQNSTDISGIFNVPQAVYDRFDVNVYFSNLSDAEKRELLFRGFEPATYCTIDKRHLSATKKVVDQFPMDKKDEDVMLKVFNLIDGMELDNEPLFAGSNIRAHKFALRLVKLFALTQGRTTLMATDILDFLDYVYMHRINQNLARIGDREVVDRFNDTKNKICSIKRRRII